MSPVYVLVSRCQAYASAGHNKKLRLQQDVYRAEHSFLVQISAIIQGLVPLWQYNADEATLGSGHGLHWISEP